MACQGRIWLRGSLARLPGKPPGYSGMRSPAARCPGSAWRGRREVP